MKEIKITASVQLKELYLESLVGKKGTVIMENDKHTGCFVKLEQPFQGYDEWFIPNESIVPC